MADQVPIPLDLFDRLRRAGLDVDAILRRAKLPRSRFSVPKPRGTTAEFFALWRAVEAESDDPGLGLRIGVAVLPDDTMWCRSPRCTRPRSARAYGSSPATSVSCAQSKSPS